MRDVRLIVFFRWIIRCRLMLILLRSTRYCEIYPEGLEIGSVRGEYAKSVGWSKFSAYFMWSVGVVFFVLLLMALVEVEIPITVDLLFTLAFFGFPSYFLFCFGTYFWCLATKNSLDDPVLFNKKTKLVYILPYLNGGFFRF